MGQATLRIFLSSTSVDLGPLRTWVAELVRHLGQFAVVMDEFPLRPTLDANEASLEQLRSCDAYVLLLAWRYGHVVPGHPLSVTHREYREARHLGLPCFVFLAGDTTYSNFDFFPPRVRDVKHYESLLAFRTEVQYQQVGFFTSPFDLMVQVASALHQYLLDLELPVHLPLALPPRVPGFTGQEAALMDLLRSLRARQSLALSTLVVGLGGVGKSALASEAMHRLADEADAFPGGLTWVRCDGQIGLEGLIWVYDQLLDAWGVRPTAKTLSDLDARPEVQAEFREQTLRSRLRRLPGPALALLDNVEVDFPLGRALEHLTPLGIKLLVTARYRPALRGLRVQSLDALNVEEAVALFRERYVAGGGRWDETRDVVPATTVVQMLGQLALTIELAAALAARTRINVPELAAELRDSDEFVHLRDPLIGTASVRYRLEQGLALLSSTQRVRFASLGLLDGPDWPRTVVEALFIALPPGDGGESNAGGSGSEDLNLLASLSLATLLPGENAATDQRVRLHPLLRELAREEWSRQPEATRQAGLLALVTAVDEFVRAHQQDFATLAREEDLVAGAVRRAADAGVDSEMLTRIAVGRVRDSSVTHGGSALSDAALSSGASGQETTAKKRRWKWPWSK